MDGKLLPRQKKWRGGYIGKNEWRGRYSRVNEKCGRMNFVCGRYRPPLYKATVKFGERFKNGHRAAINTVTYPQF
jgi:hypothetical protein